MKFRAILVVLLMMLVFTGTAWGDNTVTVFTDTTTHWANQSIIECSATGIIKGYAGNVFKPDTPVSRLDAVIMLIRALGLADQANNYDLSSGSWQFPPEVTYGKGYLALAADRGFISKDNIMSMQPTKPVTRAEVATLFATALNLSAGDYQVNFADASDIPADLLSGVAAAVKNGVMVGLPGNLFAPNQSVTRAQMAVLFSRLAESGKIDPDPGKYLIAQVVSVDPVGQKFTLQTTQGQKDYPIAPTVLMFKDNNRITMDDLSANDQVKVVLDDQGRISFLAYMGSTSAAQGSAPAQNTNTASGQGQTALPPTTTTTSSTTTTTNTAVGSTDQTAATTLDGTLVNFQGGNPLMVIFSPDGSQTQSSYPVSSDVVITKDGEQKDVTALVSGAAAEIKLVGGQITEIDLKGAQLSGNELKGYIVNVYNDHFSVHYDSGSAEQLQFNTSTVFNNDGVDTDASALKKGQRVALLKNDTLATKVYILNEPEKLFGAVKKVNDTSLDITDTDGNEVEYNIPSTAAVKDSNGNTITLTDLVKDDTVSLDLDSNGQITQVNRLSN